MIVSRLALPRKTHRHARDTGAVVPDFDATKILPKHQASACSMKLAGTCVRGMAMVDSRRLFFLPDRSAAS